MADESLLGTEGTTEGAPAETQDASLLFGDSLKETQDTDQGGTKAEGEDVEKKDEEPQGAPDEYGEFTIPEGVELDSTLLDTVSPIFKELNLTQDQAQKLVNVYGEQVKAIEQKYETAIQDQRKEWREEFKKDPKSGEILSFAKKAVDFLAKDSEETKALFTGEHSFLSDHPVFIRALAKVGKYLSEDQFVDGRDAGPPKRKDPAKVLFPGFS